MVLHRLGHNKRRLSDLSMVVPTRYLLCGGRGPVHVHTVVVGVVHR